MNIRENPWKSNVKDRLKMVLDSPTVYGYTTVCATHARQYVAVGYRIHLKYGLECTLS